MFRRTNVSPHRRSLLSLFLSSSPHSSSSCKRRTTTVLTPPEPPKRIPFTVSAHGRRWKDDYNWMRDTKDGEFVDYLRRENEYVKAYMADTCDLREKLVNEMIGRMPATLATPPEQWGPWLYYQYIPEGKEYPVLCRKLKDSDSNRFLKSAFSFVYNNQQKEEILLDWNQIAEQFGYVHIGTCQISPDHKFIAYTVDKSGSETFDLYIKDLIKDEIISSLNNTNNQSVVSLAWTGDSQYLFYTLSDSHRPSKVFCRKIGSKEKDSLIFTEKDENYIVDITSTKDYRFITINSNSRSSSEVYLVDSMNINKIKKVRKRMKNVQYFIEHHNDFFYILTNSPSEINGFKFYHKKDYNNNNNGYYLARCENEMFDKWEVILIPEEDMVIQDMDIFHEKLVLFIIKNDMPLFCSIDLPINANIVGSKRIKDLNPWYFPIPSNLCNITPGLNKDFYSTIYRAIISSPTMPDLTINYDMKNREFTIEDKTKGVFVNKPQKKNTNTFKDLSANIHYERIKVPSHDGVLIPLTILYKNDGKEKFKLNGESSGLLHGYGSYGEILDKSFCSDRLSLINRNWVLAFADVRGGGGDPKWHEGGRKSNKMNSIYDFAYCAKYLIKEGYICKNNLGAIGTSAGGFLVASTINLFPDLFSSAILKVPFLDILNTMLDPSLPLTILDYEEFGDPKVKFEFESICDVSPYENLRTNVCYPPILITSSFHDSRVGVWEGAKYVAKAREITCSLCSKNILLKTNMISGHFGEGGRFLQCEETAFDYAFLIKTLES